MYTLRPLEAWLAFHQAGSTYSLYLRRQAAMSDEAIDLVHDTKQKRLEQRLYWTVLKSECELRETLDVPQSDLCKLSYPYLFPSPPTPLSPVRSPEEALNFQTPASSTSMPSQVQSTSSMTSYQQTEEQSWFYYLSEIALRRIQNRVLNAFYRQDHRSWAQMNMSDMISIAENIETQLTIWCASSPCSKCAANSTSGRHHSQQQLDVTTCPLVSQSMSFATAQKEEIGVSVACFTDHSSTAPCTPRPTSPTTSPCSKCKRCAGKVS